MLPVNNLPFMHWLTYAKPIVSIRDHRINLETLTLGTLAEPALTFTMTHVLANLAKELAKVPQVLHKLSMDRTSASYKIKYGLAETFSKGPIRNIKNTFFT